MGTAATAGGWHDPDTFTAGDCANGIQANWLSPEIALWARDHETAVAQVEVAEAGVYDIYDLLIAESGDTQWNESAYIRIPTSLKPTGTPLFGNCGSDWIVQDPDNFGGQPPGTAMYLGTFYLDAGINDVELSHFCPLFLDGGQCAQFHFEDDPGSTCDTDNPNSVHLTGSGICLRPV